MSFSKKTKGLLLPKLNIQTPQTQKITIIGAQTLAEDCYDLNKFE